MQLSPRDPFVGVFRVDLGEAEIGLGHFDAAIDEFRKAIDFCLSTVFRVHEPGGRLRARGETLRGEDGPRKSPPPQSRNHAQMAERTHAEFFRPRSTASARRGCLRNERRGAVAERRPQTRATTQRCLRDLCWRGANSVVSRGRSSQLRARNGMMALARTPVLPEAVPEGKLSAQLRRSRPRSATGALRRLPAVCCAQIAVIPRRLAVTALGGRNVQSDEARGVRPGDTTRPATAKTPPQRAK